MIDLFQLGTSQGCVDIGHPVIVPDMIMYKFPTVWNFSLRSQMFGEFTQRYILKQQHSSPTRGNGFVPIKTDCSNLSESAGMFPFVKATKTFSSIFNQFNVIAIADLYQFIEINGVPESMHRHTGLDSSAGSFIVTAFSLYFGVFLKPGFHRVG